LLRVPVTIAFNVSTFVTSSLVVTGVLAILGGPLFLIAWRRGRRTTIRNFVISGAVIALICGVLAWSSERLVRQCQEAGSPSCFDAGGDGLRFLFVGFYAVSAWINAYFIWHD